MKDGWIRVYRKMLDNPIVMKDAEHLAVWVWLLLNATHRGYDVIFKGEKRTLCRGQLITGRKKVAQELKISESKVERILKCFEIEHQIEQQKSNKNRIITLVNWNKYQPSEQQNEQQLDNNWTTTEQQLNTNNNVNNTKNEKECKEEKKPPRHKYGEYGHVLLTDDQYSRLCEEYGEEATAKAIKKVDEYCQEHKKTYNDYNLTLRKWGYDGIPNKKTSAPTNDTRWNFLND